MQKGTGAKRRESRVIGGSERSAEGLEVELEGERRGESVGSRASRVHYAGAREAKALRVELEGGGRRECRRDARALCARARRRRLSCAIQVDSGDYNR